MRTLRAGAAGPAGVRGAALCAAAAACLIGVIWAPPASAAGWLPPGDLSAAGEQASNSQVVMSDSGEAVAIWQRSGFIDGGIYYATRSPGGGFSGPHPLALSGSQFDIAMSSDGEAAVAWRRLDLSLEPPGHVVEIATRPSGGSFSTSTRIAEIPNGIPQGIDVAINADGDIAVTWTEDHDATGSDFVRAWVRLKGGPFPSPEPVSPTPVEDQSAGSPRIALAADGEAMAVWRYDVAAEPDVVENVIQAAVRPLEGGFLPQGDISDPGGNSSAPMLAATPAGEAVAAWIRDDGVDRLARYSIRPPGGSFGDSEDLSAFGEDAFDTDIAIAPDGEAVAAWTASDGSDSVVQAADRQPGGSFGSPETVSAPSSDTRSPGVVLNDDGAGAAVWQRSNGSHLVVQAARRASSGGFSAPEDLSAAGGNAVSTTVGIDSDGGAVAAWSRESTVQAAGYDAKGPTIDGLSIPPSAVVGKPVSFSADPFDDWGVASTAFDFGDGAGAIGASASHTYSTPGAYAVTATSTDGAGTSVTEGRPIRVVASNAFGFRRLRRIARTGRAILVVKVAGPGRVVLFGRGVRRALRGAKRAGNVRIPVLPRRKVLRRLNRRHRAKVGLRVIFAPRGGPAARKSRAVVLVKRRAKHRRSARK